MTTLFKKVAIAGAIALSMGLSVAHAAATDIGTLTSSLKTFQSPDVSAPSFLNLYTFSVAPNIGTTFISTGFTFGVSGATLTSLAVYNGNFQDVALLPTSASPLTLFATTVQTVTTPDPTIPFLKTHSVSGSLIDLVPGNIYTLAIGGNVVGGTTNYANAIALAAVPEPETYAMLLAGLGMMGFVARRRAKKSDQA